MALEARAASGYKFDSWTGDVADRYSATTTINMNRNKSVTANFVLKTQGKGLYEARNFINLKRDILVIDVSASSNYMNAHMLCARNFPWASGSFTGGISALSSYKDIDILVYDYNGNLSASAANYLSEQGFKSPVYYMTSGLLDWIAEGYETFTTAEDGDSCTSLAPIAFAGPDQIVDEGQKVTLDGSGSTMGVSYSWEGPNSVDIQNPTGPKPTFMSPVLNGGDSELIFYLTVTDGSGKKDTDSVMINVNWDNAKPRAVAGPDQTVNYGDSVYLDGTGSSDPENAIASYQWTLFQGNLMPTLLNSSTATPSFKAPSNSGFVVFQLTVTDNGGLEDTDNVKITVSSSGSGGSSTLETPTGLAANAVSYRKIMLRWTDNSPDKNSSFKIERKKKFCSDDTYAWTQIATVQSVEKAKNYEDIGEFDPGMKYSYRVRAYSGSDNSEYSNCASIIDPMPSASGTPSAPVNLVANYSSASTVDLSWDQWGSTVTKFEIYRDMNNSGSWTLLDTIAPDVLTYSDNTATNNQTTSFYTYKVKACSAAGCSPSTYKVGVPFNPTDLSVGENTQGKVALQWTDNSDDERGFEIYRKTGGCSSTASWEKVKQAGISRETVTDGNATSGTTYSYKIRAYYRSWGIPYVYGYSDWSDCVEITAP